MCAKEGGLSEGFWMYGGAEFEDWEFEDWDRELAEG